MNHQDTLVSINVLPILEEAFVDCLLAIDFIDGFSSTAVSAHGCCEHEKMSLAEQVAGRQKQVNFRIYLAEDHLKDLIQQLKSSFSGTGIQYWVLPVLDQGHF